MRAEAQRACFNLPAWPTTTIGSFRRRRSAACARLQKGNLDESLPHRHRGTHQAGDYRAGTSWADVLVHGEAERNDMVEYFRTPTVSVFTLVNGLGAKLRPRCVKPPVVIGDVKCPEPDHR
ncbi:hypothetical protein [Enterobacter chuandaensis]|uniref:hypothetical protein n=1 Tax=Enterobacter chuandaensis TaxID=2497875 RepID=UPI002811D030|nr:hypothetical protein [Enterobacter chuandaensis]